MASRGKFIHRNAANSGGSTAVLRRRRRLKKTEDKVEATLVDFIEGEVLMGYINKPSHQSYRHGDYAHVSDLIGKCMRRTAVADKHNLPIPTEDIWPSLRLTFAQGEAMASVVVEDSVDRSPDTVYARWSCMCGEVSETGTVSDTRGKRFCERCRTGNTKYNEITLRNEEYKIIGNVDLMLLLQGALYITEIKSIKGTAWAEMAAPLPDHVLQVLLYWWLARELGWIIHDKVSILYASKDYRFGNPYKEYTLQPTKMLHRLDDYLEDAMALKVYKETGQLPPKVMCGDISCTKAKKCHVAEPCFDEYGAGA